ncbi:KIR protein [Plasmodium knowlesi strain H]|uniref:KIR protein n=3 Tax=Plasmodium knowlesi TaxID=5850 RepID=A0A5K1U298_PLAKH|nr:KIR protein [Plasmodium knowlesi strain H]OTN65063.1 KIR protein [Plasmodium knowlesi]CAA9988182.1 KIR protein [Plasmodium knowlesi strain H]SBO20095.1 KIR protein [Plasmodium knowlesi strain H]SBO20691.1 KIR protein [Plasmodium knowlesi strain H]VVS77656.1 KIR protein [Plasmodium knowlesi strain H]|eukprot:XP_002259159.1 KIR protein [Plasmodium knowlesi strain H]
MATSSPLPSEQKYEALGKERNCTTSHGDPSKNGSILVDLGVGVGVFTSAKNDAEQILEAYCRVFTQDRGSSPYYEPCHFFYFWLGNLLKDKLTGPASLHDAMKPAYTHLGNFQFKGAFKEKCEDLYPYIGKDLFDLYKKIFDYAYNYKSLESKSEVKNKFLCSSECATYVKEVEQAYSSVNSACGSDASGDKFCQELKTEYSKYFDNNHKPKWKCTPVTEGESEDEEEEDHDDDDNPLWNIEEIEEEKLSALPSRAQFYKSFEGGESSCGGEDENDWTWIKQMRHPLGEDKAPDINEFTERIIKGLCYVQRMKSSSTTNNNKYCNFFYFWVGGMLWRKFKWRNKSFRDNMEKIKVAVEQNTSEHGCTFNFPTRGMKYFMLNKILFDYFEDKNYMKTALGEQHGGMNCANPYYKYLQRAYNAYWTMRGLCPDVVEGGGSNNGWCTEFNNLYNVCKNGGKADTHAECKVALTEPLGTLCTDRSNPASMEEENALSTPTGTSSSTTSIPGTVAGGTLATVGLPTIGFFLYKYTSLFDGIKNSLFGGSNNTGGRNRGRGRRSTIRHQHFDDNFTGNDSSTLGDDSSTLGGGGGESSTLGGSSTDVSTIYNEPPSRPTGSTRTRTNNRRQGNIRYYAT